MFSKRYQVSFLPKSKRSTTRERYKKRAAGFTLIELLVVIAIIGLLSSIALIALVQARQKARDTKRIGDMTQMNTALELYFATYKGYPGSSSGIPVGLTQFASTLPVAPTPADGVCDGLAHSAACSNDDSNCAGVAANTYYYVPTGSFLIGAQTYYKDYSYYFCLGQQTGSFGPGEHILTPRGVR